MDAPPEALDFARTVVRRGIESDIVHLGYRQGQQVLWRRWMETAERLATSRSELTEVLNVSLDLLSRFVDEVLGRVFAEMQREREQVLGGELARRAETVRLILDGAPLDESLISRRLRLDLRLHHTGVVLWTDSAQIRTGALETAAIAVGRAAAGRRPLTVAAGVTTLWAWISSDQPLQHAHHYSDVAGIDDRIRIAIGPSATGVNGFRTSHDAARTMHRLLRNNAESGRIATYAELEITALAAHDPQRAADFVLDTLGPLADESATAARLRETLRVYLDEAENAPRAAARLQVHRNTVLQRVRRATELMGYGPGDRRLAVELALELRRRLGPTERLAAVPTHGL